MSARRTRLITTLALGASVAWTTWPSGVAPTDQLQASSDPDTVTTRSSSSDAGASLEGAVRAPVGRAVVDIPSATVGAEAYFSDQMLVAVRAGDSLAAIAARHGAVVVREAGPSGWGAVSSVGRPEVLDRLAADPGVRAAGPHAMTWGAGKKGNKGKGKGNSGSSGASEAAPAETEASLRELQWHLGAANVPSDIPAGLQDIVVAVLDTGVAYTNDGGCSRAPSLTGDFVDGWDFVNDDDLPCDDHGHGTHIASTIASAGDLLGVAPGVTVMPLKVLDADNSGSELDLVEAVHRAVERGAHIVNMSLSFHPDYTLSLALAEALEAAEAADVVLVAASGNGALDEVSFPAASPAVVAVGASCLGRHGMEVAEYSNVGAGLDLYAPGGCLDRDHNGDDQPDGILAESFANGDPAQGGAWWMAGSSQAAAMVSGTVARQLASGLCGTGAAILLQKEASEGPDGAPGDAVLMQGSLDVAASVVHNNSSWARGEKRYHVAILPYLETSSGVRATPSFRVSVLDQDLYPATGMTVVGTLFGSDAAQVTCELGATGEGECVLVGSTVSLNQGHRDGTEPWAWRLTVDALVSGDVIFRGHPLAFATDALAAIAADPGPSGENGPGVPAIHWPDGPTDMGVDVREAYAVVDVGAGTATGPSALLFTAEALEAASSDEDGVIDGTGISTSPFGYRRVVFDRLDMFGGSGISTSPFGRRLRLALFNGSGISTSPFSAFRTFSLAGARMTSGSSLDGQAVLFGTAELTGGDSEAIEQVLEDGGWRADDGSSAASLLGHSSVLAVEATQHGAVEGLGAEPLVP